MFKGTPYALVATDHVAFTASKKIEILLDLFRDVGERKRPYPDRCQFDPQRRSFEVAADREKIVDLFACRGKVGLNTSRSLDKEAH